jgi:hypothetical protein
MAKQSKTVGEAQATPLGERFRAGKARELFESYPNAERFYFTSDGQAFFTEGDAEAHAITLKESGIELFNR